MLDRGDIIGHCRKIADSCAVGWRRSRAGYYGEPDARRRQTGNQDHSHRDVSLNHCLPSITSPPTRFG
jgi:hypothetical protein